MDRPAHAHHHQAGVPVESYPSISPSPHKTRGSTRLRSPATDGGRRGASAFNNPLPTALPRDPRLAAAEAQRRGRLDPPARRLPFDERRWPRVSAGEGEVAAADSPNAMSASATLIPAAGGKSSFTGYTKLCKGLAVILFLAHILVQLFPSAAGYLALIPARTIPFAWNLVTAGYIEQTIPGVIVSIVGLLLFGKVLEPLWGAKELLKFIFIVNISTSACVFASTIVLYYITQEESYLYTPLSGFYGVLSGLLVGIKQILPDQELNLFVLKISAKWIPSIVAFTSVAVSFFLKESMAYLPIILFGIYVSWIYLRYFQKRLEVGLRGDPSDEFSFSSFFPGFLRPILDPIASIFHKLFCGRSARYEGTGQALDGSQFPGSGSIEANRRRERGQRALEQRLAEKLAAVRSAEGTAPPPQQQPEEDASDKV